MARRVEILYLFELSKIKLSLELRELFLQIDEGSLWQGLLVILKLSKGSLEFVFHSGISRLFFLTQQAVVQWISPLMGRLDGLFLLGHRCLSLRKLFFSKQHVLNIYPHILVYLGEKKVVFTQFLDALLFFDRKGDLGRLFFSLVALVRLDLVVSLEFENGNRISGLEK